MDADRIATNDQKVPVPLPILTHHDSLEYPISDEKNSDSDHDIHSKREGEKTEVNVAIENIKEIYDTRSGDPIPEPEDAEPELWQLTVRAIVVGCLLGSVVQASNLYLGLKTGFTFGPQLFGAIFGFAILKPMSRLLPRWAGGGYFGPKENCTVQTAATAAGGLGIIYVTGVPAMYQLGLLKSPTEDIGRLFAFAAVSAFYGMMFAIPLRRWYILRLKLVFPTPTATAFTIRSLHDSKGGAIAAKKKAICLGISFTGSILLRVVSEYAPGILWDWHIFYWFVKWGWNAAIHPENWGWFFEWTPAFLGAGILSGVNASCSFFAGSVLAWGIIGPSLIVTGRAIGRDVSPDGYTGPAIISYYSMKSTDPTSNNVSPRYWLLWVGVLVMVAGAFAEIAVQGPRLYRGLRDASKSAINSVQVRRGKDAPFEDAEPATVDPAGKEEQVPTWVWVPGLIVMVILTCVVLSVCFHMNVGIAILAIFLGFFWSFIGVQSAGDTDINPISTCAKASQLVVGGTTRGMALDAQGTAGPAQMINLLAGLVAGAAAAQTVDMTGDLKTGHLLRAKPRNQFVAQFFGAACSIFLSTGLYVVFTKAYPCINDANAETCEFGVPSVSAWKAVAVAVTSPHGLPLPTSSGITALCLAIVSVLIIVARVTIVPPKYRGYVPNPTAAGLAFVLPQTQYASAMMVASLAAHVWKKRNPASYDMYVYALAAGMMAGEGIGGVVNAILVIAGVDGGTYGTAVACPAEQYCG